jgi:hypothetical protein
MFLEKRKTRTKKMASTRFLAKNSDQHERLYVLFALASCRKTSPKNYSQ